MKKIALIGMAAAALLIVTGSAGAQGLQGAGHSSPRITAPSAVYIELLGNGLLYSINYDHAITPHIAARVGVMGLGGATDSVSAAVLAAPVMVSYLFGGGNSHFEVGLGVMLAAGAIEERDPMREEGFSGAVGTATVGYRYQRPHGGFIFRTGLTPFFDHTGIAPSLGVSFGYGF